MTITYLCSKCNKLFPNQKFCDFCGTKLIIISQDIPTNIASLNKTPIIDSLTNEIKNSIPFENFFEKVGECYYTKNIFLPHIEMFLEQKAVIACFDGHDISKFLKEISENHEGKTKIVAIYYPFGTALDWRNSFVLRTFFPNIKDITNIIVKEAGEVIFRPSR